MEQNGKLRKQNQSFIIYNLLFYTQNKKTYHTVLTSFSVFLLFILMFYGSGGCDAYFLLIRKKVNFGQNK